jgi:hypothetical protein
MDRAHWEELHMRKPTKLLKYLVLLLVVGSISMVVGLSWTAAKAVAHPSYGTPCCHSTGTTQKPTTTTTKAVTTTTARATTTTQAAVTTTTQASTSTTSPATTTTQASTTPTTQASTTTTTQASTTTTTAPSLTFADVSSTHVYRAAILAEAQRGIIEGYQVGVSKVFRPDEPVLRAQYAKMVVSAFSVALDPALPLTFTDLGTPTGDPYPHQYVAAAAHAGITNGIAPGLFGPWNQISRAQVVTMIVRALDELKPGSLMEPPLGYVGSLGAFDETHSPNMRLAEYNGLLVGVQGFGPSWGPWINASRGEVAQMLWNASKK